MVEVLAKDGDGVLEPRAYQLEMLRDSMQRNIIVAMDTGSGKTQIAVLRIAAELEQCHASKRVWFLCPKVALAQQQHRVISLQQPAYLAKLLTGKDGCDFWSTQSVWDEALLNIRIVVCTHDILCDALTHAFVRMEDIALLVFDEAHYCRGNHAANRIMQNFYHPARLLRNTGVPHILGLTASPIFNDGVQGLQIVEKNLDAICRTPRIHRAELLNFVHQPELLLTVYESHDGLSSKSFLVLESAYHMLDIKEDPYVRHLKQPEEYDEAKLEKVYLNQKTYCREQLKRLIDSARTIDQELGCWATETYVRYCACSFEKSREDMMIFSNPLEEQETLYISDFLTGTSGFDARSSAGPGPAVVSRKVEALIDILVHEARPGFSGIVFVTTRVAVCMLKRLLQEHPKTKDLFRIGASVGSSTNAQRKNKLSDSIATDKDNEEIDVVLDDLRSGKKNLLISTTVVEEGIDITACNTVLCFDQPMNLVSFIQRRGRARSSKSKYYILMPKAEKESSTARWLELEEEMKQKYEDEMRELARLEELELSDSGNREFEVQSTGAKITLRDAVAHLYHFCNTLPKVQYASLSPVFACERTAHEESISCSVLLPNCVDASVREFSSSQKWISERFAKMDAAFEAYLGLYHAGLINDHLLPHTSREDEEIYQKLEKRPNVVFVDQVLDPWHEVAEAWKLGASLRSFDVTITNGENATNQMRMILPCSLTNVESFALYYDSETHLEVRFSSSQSAGEGDESIELLQEFTKTLLFSTFRTRMNWEKNEFPVLFGPKGGLTKAWIDHVREVYPATNLLTRAKHSPCSDTVVRDENGRPYVLDGLEVVEEILHEGDVSVCTTKLRAYRFSRRTDYLHSVSQGDIKKATVPALLDPEKCVVDELPASYARFATFVPSIIHRVGRRIIVNSLCSSILDPVNFVDTELVLTAISAPGALENSNYQRLEFLGDAFLKYYTAVSLTADHPTYHEGYLAHLKDRIVSNKALAVAATEVGLDRYILRKSFRSSKWRPLCNDEILRRPPSDQEELSTKVLADVVEALIGAAYLDGGETRLLACLQTLLPKTTWRPLSDSLATLSSAAPPSPLSDSLPQSISRLEELTPYHFVHPLLALQAITHPSHMAPSLTFATPSYQRLEFLGDAVLDIIVTRMIYAHDDPPLPTPRMHLLRSAAVNADFLAYLALARSIDVPTTDVRLPTLPTSPLSSPRKHRPKPGDDPSSEPTLEPSITHSSKPINLLTLMRHSPSLALVTALSATTKRFESLRSTIDHALTSGTEYPWTALASFAPEKLVSDLVESVLGAIYTDSAGDMRACETWLENLGVLPWLRRALAEGVKVWHPKEEVGVLGSRLMRSEKGRGVEYLVSLEKGDAGEERVGVGDGLVEGEKAEDEVVGDRTVVEGGRFVCRLYVGGEEIAVARGMSRKIAETRAADLAAPVLRARLEAQEGRERMPRDEDLLAARDANAGESDVVSAGDSLGEGDEEDSDDDDDDIRKKEGAASDALQDVAMQNVSLVTGGGSGDYREGLSGSRRGSCASSPSITGGDEAILSDPSKKRKHKGCHSFDARE